MIYVLVLTIVALTFITRALVAPTLGSQSLYLFLMPAIFVAGIVGGLGPGLLSTCLCLALHLYATGEYRNLSALASLGSANGSAAPALPQMKVRAP